MAHVPVAAFSVFLALPIGLRAQAPFLRCELSKTPRATLWDGTDSIVVPVQAHSVATSNAGDAAFSSPGSRIDIGPDARLGFGSDQSFRVGMRIRTGRDGFCTPLMCREGNAVNFSFVMGRQPGRISFEIWTWARDRAISTVRVDDGKWHEIVGAYDAATQTMGILVDGVVQAVIPVGSDYRPSPRPLLRLGNNIGAHQPFHGSLGAVYVDRGVPENFARAIELDKQLSVLRPGAADGMLDGWLLRMRAPKPPVATNAADWSAKVRQTQKKLQEALGLLPPPYAPQSKDNDELDPSEATDFATYRPTLPLAVQRGGRLDRDSYTLTRIYWQTVRGYFAGGYLYEPTSDPDEKRPAVLCPHGHFQDGARHPVVQSRCITLAKNGYVVLAVDSVHVTDDPIGLSPLSLMTWNNLRGLELLAGLRQVDANRIGCTGASGGGQQTFYLTGLRTGLAAVVPAVMVCYFEEILLSSGVHCRCNFTPGVMGFADEPLLSACFAPKPQLFLSVTGDWTKNFPTKGFPEVRAIYAHFDATDAVASRQWQSHHDYNRDMRNAMYAFFGRHLKGQPKPPAELEPEGIRTESRNVLIALDRRDVPQDLSAVKQEFRHRLSRPPAAAKLNPQDAEERRQTLIDRFGMATDADPITATPEGGAFRWDGYAARRYRMASSDGIVMPAVVLRPKGTARRATLIVGTTGKAAVLRGHAALVRDLLAAGHAVALVDIRYSGELDRAHTWREPYGKIFGKDVGVVAVTDIVHSLRFISRLVGVPSSECALLAMGEFGAPAIYAAAIGGGCGTVIATELGPTYRAVDRQPKIAGILRVGDLPDAVALLPRTVNLWVGGCPDPSTYRARTSSVSIQRSPLTMDQVLDALRR